MTRNTWIVHEHQFSKQLRTAIREVT